MNQHIMQLKIEKSKQQKKLKEFEIKITRLLNELVTLSCPYYENIEDINAAAIEQIGDELFACHNDAIKCKNQLKTLNRELGED